MHTFTGGEFIIMGVPGETVDRDTAEIIKRVQPSGFILFARNIKTPQQLRALTDELRKLVPHEPIITIDQEGGRVARLKEFMSEPPSALQLSDAGDLGLVERHGVLTGKLLRLFGFNLNLAPVLDILVDENNDNSLRGGRSYGRDAATVIKNAAAFAKGMKSENILSCGKHFPGYSAAKVDPHEGLPRVNRSYEEMMALEWKPFKELAPTLDFMMVGHVVYPLIDQSEQPASLSPYMGRKLLRDEWKFRGLTITDDMDMGAIVKEFGSVEAAALALTAGNDFVLVCHNMKGIVEIAEALKKVPDAVKQESYERILELRMRLAKPFPFSMDLFAELDQSVKKLRSDATSNAKKETEPASR